MDITSLLLEIYGRIPPLAESAVQGLSAEQLATAPATDTNPIGWLIWHLTRVQDHHVTGMFGGDQIWTDGEWAARCGLEANPSNTGYGHGPDDVRAVRPESADVLLEYLDAVQARTSGLLGSVTPEDLDRVVDKRWDPPVTMGVRLISIADDCMQHAGQAAYVRGLLGY